MDKPKRKKDIQNLCKKVGHRLTIQKPKRQNGDYKAYVRKKVLYKYKEKLHVNVKKGDKIPMQNKRSVFNTKGHTYTQIQTGLKIQTDTG